MCGIIGAFAGNWNREGCASLFRACEAIRHRGPDDEGFVWLSGTGNSAFPFDAGQLAGMDRMQALCRCGERISGGGLLLGHRRLSIIDLSRAGHQPMSNADGTVWIVYNGEVYNFIELRRELEEGYHFQSECDTEVIIAAYERWGASCFQRFLGMFALCIVDLRSTDARVIFARDHFGIKPLYYSVLPGGGFAFGSEIKALLEMGACRVANAQSCLDYLVLGTCDWGAETMFRDIKQLPPAHVMQARMTQNGFVLEVPTRYWDCEIKAPIRVPERDAVREFRQLYLDSVRLHLRSDVPIATALSGGVDSTTIISAMRHLEAGTDIRAFGYCAEESRISEERWIDLAARHSRVTLRKVRTDATRLLATLETLVDAQDEPFGSTSIHAQYSVFEAMKLEHIKVSLDGQGADEFLAGYDGGASRLLLGRMASGDIYGALSFFRSARNSVSGGGIALLKGIVSSTRLGRRYRKLRILASAGDLGIDLKWFNQRGCEIQLLGGLRHRESLRRELRRQVMQTSLPSLMRYADRNSMWHSVESRVPFLNPRLVEFVLSLPDSYIISEDGMTKSVLRQAMRGIAPNEVLDRRDKIGFQTPEFLWMKSQGKNLLKLIKSGADAIPFLNTRMLAEQFSRYIDNHSHADWVYWRHINLIAWVNTKRILF